MFVFYTFIDCLCMDNNNMREKHFIATIITLKRVNVKSFFVSLLKRKRNWFVFWSLIEDKACCRYKFCPDPIGKDSCMTDISEVDVRDMGNEF